MPSKKHNAFTGRELKFIEYLPTSSSRAEAAVKAGYSKKNPEVTAYKLMKRKEISDEVHRRQEKINEKLELKRERIIIGLLDMFDGEKEIVIDGKVYKIKEKAADRISAAAQLNKMQGFYAKEEVEHKHTGEVRVVLYVPDNGRDVVE